MKHCASAVTGVGDGVSQYAGGRLFTGAIGGILMASLAGCGNVGTEPHEATGRAQQAVVATAPLALDDAAKRERAIDILTRFVPHAESYFRPSDLQEGRTDRYDAVGSGVTQPRGAGDIAFAYVTLLAASPDQPTFGGVPREVMVDHTIQSIRHEALTHSLSGAGYNRWGNGTWQAALETVGWAFAAHRLWSVLDADTQALVRRVVSGEANVLMTKAIATGEEGDTGAEDNGWNSSLPALAAVMFPEDPNAPSWESTTIRLAMNASSTTADQTATDLVDGQPISTWMKSVNLHADLTMENHGYFNPIYQQVAHVDIGEAAIAYGLAGHPIPQALGFRAESVWDAILGRLATDDGDFALTAGQDWISKDYQHLDYLAIMATRFQRPDASVFESRALDLVGRRQAAHADGSVLGQAQLGYESMLMKRMASLWWNHRLFGPSPQPSEESFEEARAEHSGVKAFPYSDFIAARLGGAFVSMSWDTARPLGLVIPQGDEHLDDPVFAYYAPGNLIGSAAGTVGVHSCACEPTRFSTAGTIGTRRFSMTAFSDGTTILLDRGQGSTFAYALESIPGLTGKRPVWSEGGMSDAAGDAGVGTLPGAWVNIADRLGMVVRGGAGMGMHTVAGTNPQLVVTGSLDTGTGNRGAMLLPLVEHARTAALAASVVQPSTPETWSALVGRAGDTSLRMATARWGGPAGAEFELSDERGAPVPEQDAELDGTTSRFEIWLPPSESRGQTMRYFVQTAGAGAHAYQDSEGVAVLYNPTDRPVSVVVTYVPPSGEAQRTKRTLAALEEARARLVDGTLTLAGPELDPLLEARDALTPLLARLDDMGKRRRHGEVAHTTRMAAAAREASRALDLAIAEATAAVPNLLYEAMLVRRAHEAIEQLAHQAEDAPLPPELRAAARRAAQAADEALDQAKSQDYAAKVWVEPTALAQPGEPLTVRVGMLNRGLSTLRGGRLIVTGADGSTFAGPVPMFSMLGPGRRDSASVTLSTPATAKPFSTTLIHAEVRYRKDWDWRFETVATADRSLVVLPAVDLTLTPDKIPLAAGGTNQAIAHFVNYLERPLDLAIATTPPDGANATPASQHLVLPVSGTGDATLLLNGVTRTSGTDRLTLLATTSNGAPLTASSIVAFSDDIARNAFAAPWPKGTAASHQAAYPPALAFDGDASTFWVSAGTTSGEGPSPTQPIWLTVDFGFSTRIGSVRMVPRANYGPKAYTIEVSDDGVAWTEVGAVPSAPNGTVTTELTPVTTRQLRLRITGGWDRIQPPRNVQVAALEVRAAP